ncbi:MAG: VTT domain-containing protein [Anaerolineae bacterium]|nr:VTT domain-containing protein [Anaerolineae bacterium]
MTQGTNTPEAAAKQELSRRQTALRLAAVIIFTLAVSLLAIRFRHQIQGMKELGYPGIFLVSLLTSATVVLPAPGLAFTFAMGHVLNPLLVGLAAGLGETFGEMTGYIAGRAGRSAFGQDPRYERLESITRRHGAWAVLVLSILPIGVFDVVGIAAGAMRMPVLRFAGATWLGKTIKTVAFALAGAHSLTWIMELLP